MEIEKLDYVIRQISHSKLCLSTVYANMLSCAYYLEWRHYLR